ncbi:kinesin motor domain-containing protein [Morchella conica CCBAS932]|uniref:Kinesin-like protein n=2 Tax=Morchella sect. Distantes TaxID=1051054 RepID=A0A3N4KEI7_9PEZI|nr:kinesin motor domain-containing protein [Morchella conica CCBAS932]
MGRSNSSSGFSKSVGSRPNSSLGIRGGVPAPAPRTGISAPGPRPTSSLSDRPESGGSGGIDPTAAMPRRKAWDLKGRLEDTESAIEMMKSMMMQERTESNNIKEQLEDHKLKAYQLETMRVTLETKNTQVQLELENTMKKASELERLLDDERRDRRQERDDAARRLRDETDDIRRKLRDEVEALIKSNREAMENLERRARMEIEDERAARQREVQEISTRAAMERQKLEMEMGGSAREIRGLKTELEATITELEREKAMTANLKSTLSESSSTTLQLESSARALRTRIEMLESAGQSQAQSFAELEQRLRQALEETAIAKEKLRVEETLRRKLHNQVQELKGNIRVFCRVRPTLPAEAGGGAEMQFPDTDKEGKEIQIIGAAEKSALGNVVTKAYPFSFDKVFGPTAQNPEVFEEISQLVQSALDGYNVCIFCYGQTGSGKTYTMSSSDGMIPKAVHQIYETAKQLEEKGWTYTMEGQFVEVYNENINDLLGQADDFDKKKHEIRHDPKECKTTITDINTVVLDNPAKVEQILNRASKTRSVAATQANERSSRSHSVFILKLRGVNSVTGERSEGTLNLVDLAGSERLAHSQATGDRLKETQSINKSLSCLGDVIAALGNGKEGAHIPYRNSKLTYLLQYSLGGNSKCLMFVMVSPMQAHLAETLTSLKFATKVNNTSIGTAKKQSKVSA